MEEGAITGSWVHAEDDGDKKVFWPSDSPELTPSRAPRTAYDLAGGGELTTYAAGPDDRRVPSGGKWRIDGDHLVLEPADGPPERYVVDEATPGRLVLRATK
ncbi:MAG: lipocalin family protein [Solirubrobacteraceae bacterium]